MRQPGGESSGRRWLPRGAPRWALVVGAVVLLALIPVGIAARPVTAGPIGAGALLTKILSSDGVPHSGYAESVAGLGLPDIPRAGRVVSLLSQRTRMRVWYAGPERWRVDELTLAGERDDYREPDTLLGWDSGTRRAVSSDPEPVVRFARPSDLLPPELARRLAGAAKPSEVRRIGDLGIAGVTAAGLRITPSSATTTIARADIWADPQSGLPLRVEVFARGARTPIITTAFLDLREAMPSAADVLFAVPADARMSIDQSPDIAQAIARFSPFLLPWRLAGGDRRTLVANAAATYGSGFDIVAVLALPDRFRPQTQAFLSQSLPVQGPWYEGRLVTTPLVNGLIVRESGQAVVLSGTVTPEVLERDAADALLGLRGQRD